MASSDCGRGRSAGRSRASAGTAAPDRTCLWAVARVVAASVRGRESFNLPELRDDARRRLLPRLRREAARGARPLRATLLREAAQELTSVELEALPHAARADVPAGPAHARVDRGTARPLPQAAQPRASALFALQIFAYTVYKPVSMFDVAMIVENERQRRADATPNGGLYDRWRALRRRRARASRVSTTVNEKWQRNVSLLQPAADRRPRAAAATRLRLLAPLLRRAPRLLDALPRVHVSDDDADVAHLLLPRHRADALQHARRRLEVPARHRLHVRRAARGLRGSHAFAVLRAFVLFVGYFLCYISSTWSRSSPRCSSALR
jgi:hypothetical protein